MWFKNLIVFRLPRNRGLGADAGERFETDMAPMTGELSRLLADLVAALGGEAPAAT